MRLQSELTLSLCDVAGGGLPTLSGLPGVAIPRCVSGEVDWLVTPLSSSPQELLCSPKRGIQNAGRNDGSPLPASPCARRSGPRDEGSGDSTVGREEARRGAALKWKRWREDAMGEAVMSAGQSVRQTGRNESNKGHR